MADVDRERLQGRQGVLDHWPPRQRRGHPGCTGELQDPACKVPRARQNGIDGVYSDNRQVEGLATACPDARLPGASPFECLCRVDVAPACTTAQSPTCQPAVGRCRRANPFPSPSRARFPTQASATSRSPCCGSGSICRSSSIRQPRVPAGGSAPTIGLSGEPPTTSPNLCARAPWTWSLLRILACSACP